MAKYHITKKGEPGRCSATKGKCPLGGEGEHYPTREAAAAAYEKNQNLAQDPLAGMKRQGPPPPTNNPPAPPAAGDGDFERVDFMKQAEEPPMNVDDTVQLPAGDYRLVESEVLEFTDTPQGEAARELLFGGSGTTYPDENYSFATKEVDGDRVATTHELSSGVSGAVVSEDLYQSMKAAGAISEDTYEANDTRFTLEEPSAVGAFRIDEEGLGTMTINRQARALDYANKTLTPPRGARLSASEASEVAGVASSKYYMGEYYLGNGAADAWDESEDFQKTVRRAYRESTSYDLPEAMRVNTLVLATEESITEDSAAWAYTTQTAFLPEEDMKGFRREEKHEVPFNEANRKHALALLNSYSEVPSSPSEPVGWTKITMDDKPYFLQVDYE